MFKFTSAVMWVLMEAFGFNKEFLPCKPNQKEDRFLLSEILKAGNLGHYDVRENHVIYESRIEVFWTPIGIIYISIRGRFISWLAKVV